MSLRTRIGESLGRSDAPRQGAERARSGGQRGFTLFELLVVVAIIGVLSIVAVPQFSKWRNQRAANGATQSLLAHMKQARVIAMAENRSVSITFTSSSYTYDDDAGGTCGLCKPQTVPFSTFSSNLTLSPTTTRTFTSRGTVGPVNPKITLTVGSFSHDITLNAIGRAYSQ